MSRVEELMDGQNDEGLILNFFKNFPKGLHNLDLRT